MDDLRVKGPSAPATYQSGSTGQDNASLVVSAFLEALGVWGQQRQQQAAPASADQAASAVPTVDSASAGAGSGGPSPSSSNTPSPEIAAAFLARPIYSLDHSRISTAAGTLGESRGATDSQVVLDKRDPDHSRD